MSLQRQRQEAAPKGHIITFYSYKGGTGRSMAVANIAWILALSGERVLVVDWDLEAPGIHRYFHPFLDDKELLDTEGLLDFAEKSAGRAAVASSPLTEADVDIIEYITVMSWPARSSLSWETFGPRARIDLLGAGRQAPTYSRKLNAFNWIDFYEKLGGRRTFELVREQLKDVYDYVLIDSRTGVSDTSGICTVEMPDTVVVCFTLNDQSIIGASAVAESILGQRNSGSAAIGPPGRPGLSGTSRPAADRPFRIFPVPTRVEIVGESARRQIALALAQRKFAGFLEHLDRNARSRYWGRVQLAYFPFYAFEEIPAVFGDPADQDLSLTTPLKQIARLITDNEQLELRPLGDGDEAERLRKEVLGWYLRTGDASALDPAQVAQTTYDQLDRASQALMRKVLLRLVQVGPESGLSVATRSIADFDSPFLDMVRTLSNEGLVLQTGTSAAIADKRIIEGWDLLNRWAKEDEEFLISRQDLSVACTAWSRHGKDESGLLRGTLLQDAVAWGEQRPDDLTQAEREFIDTSRQFDLSKNLTTHAPAGRIKFKGFGVELDLSARTLYVGLAVLASILVFTAGPQLYRLWRDKNTPEPSRSSAMDLLAAAYKRREAGDLRAATALLSDALRLARESAMAAQMYQIYRDRAFCYKLAGEWEPSIADLSSALDIIRSTGPNDGERTAILRDRAWAYLRLRDLELSIADYQSLLGLNQLDAALAASFRSTHDALTKILTPRFKRAVPFFVFTESGESRQNTPAAIPQPVQQLVGRFESPLNLTFWWCPISASQIRYTNQDDAQLAAQVARVLRDTRFQVDGPELLSQAVNRSRRIELWFHRDTPPLSCNSPATR